MVVVVWVSGNFVCECPALCIDEVKHAHFAECAWSHGSAPSVKLMRSAGT
jgi:hypothetical protein